MDGEREVGREGRREGGGGWGGRTRERKGVGCVCVCVRVGGSVGGVSMSTST